MTKNKNKSKADISIKFIFGIIIPLGIHLALPYFKMYQNVDPNWWKASSAFLVGVPFLVTLNLLGFEFDLETLSKILRGIKE